MNTLPSLIESMVSGVEVEDGGGDGGDGGVEGRDGDGGEGDVGSESWGDGAGITGDEDGGEGNSLVEASWPQLQPTKDIPSKTTKNKATSNFFNISLHCVSSFVKANSFLTSVPASRYCMVANWRLSRNLLLLLPCWYTWLNYRESVNG